MNKESDNGEPSIDDIVASIRRIISDEETKTRKPPVMAAAKNGDILELTNMLNDDGSVTPLPVAAPRSDAKSDVKSVAKLDPPPLMPFADSDDDAPIYADRLPIDRPPTDAPRPINRPQPVNEKPAPAPAMTPVSAPQPVSAPMRPAADPAFAPQPQAPSSSNRLAANMAATNLGIGSGVTLTPINSVPMPQPGGSGIVSSQAAGAATAAFDRLAQAALQNAPLPSAAGPASMPGGAKSVEDLAREMLRPMLQQWMDANLPGMVERLVQQEIQRLTKR